MASCIVIMELLFKPVQKELPEESFLNLVHRYMFFAQPEYFTCGPMQVATRGQYHRQHFQDVKEAQVY